jgi:hypothetical protein
MKYVYPEPVSGITRTRIISDGERRLDRQSVYPVYLPTKCWNILKELSREQGRSGSQIIESLILQVAAGKPKNHQQMLQVFDSKSENNKNSSPIIRQVESYKINKH